MNHPFQQGDKHTALVNERSSGTFTDLALPSGWNS
jgi:hypothetical protein